VLFSSRTKLIAVVVGIVLAGMPMAAFSLWLDYFIEQQGREEVDLMARRQLALADARVARVVDSLGELAKRGFEGCRAVHVEALRQANFATIPVKELSLVGPDGQTLCTDLGIALGMRKVVASQPLTFDGGVTIEVISLADRKDAMIRLRRGGVGDTVGVAALMPMELFFPQLSNRGGPSNSHARLMTRDGTLLAENGVALSGSADRRFTTTLQSERHNLTAIVSMPREQVLAGHADLRRAGTVVSGVIALAIIGVALVAGGGRGAHPIDDIERALEAGEFVPYFQPIINITSGRLRGAEVLMRWRKPDGSLALPAAFIPLLESSGLIFEVTRALMRRARDDVAAAYADRPHLRLGFNLAASHFNDESIVRDVRSIFERSPVRLSQVVLEVTERQPLQNLTETRRVVAALQGLGVAVAIDDVGTGHSGLSYILKLGADLIKIDKIFIDAIGTDRNSTTIIETLVDLARNMRMDVVAEGVERFEQVVLLRDLGIQAAQGYVFAPPLPASSFLQLIEAVEPRPQAAAVERGEGAPAPEAAGGRSAAA
jgi:sensor c-di-GMP phosphodiesterase-like protein